MMFANAFGVKKRHSDEAEKPFWISYADLMTAMMVLFLVVMVASLSSRPNVFSVQNKVKNEGTGYLQIM